MRYLLLMPSPDPLHGGNRMLDYIMGQKPGDLEYVSVYGASVVERESRGATCEFLWQRHNVGDEGDGNRPLGKHIRSMCVGDLFLFSDDGQVWVAESVGFRQLQGDEIPATVRSRIARS